MEKVYVGIDVSKERLDVAILPFGEFIKFENSLELPELGNSTKQKFAI